MEIRKNDLFLICSDGLSDYLPHHEIEEILKMPSSLERMAQTLVNQAKIAKSADNITAVLVEIVELNEIDEAPKRRV